MYCCVQGCFGEELKIIQSPRRHFVNFLSGLSMCSRHYSPSLFGCGWEYSLLYRSNSHFTHCLNVFKSCLGGEKNLCGTGLPFSGNSGNAWIFLSFGDLTKGHRKFMDCLTALCLSWISWFRGWTISYTRRRVSGILVWGQKVWRRCTDGWNFDVSDDRFCLISYHIISLCYGL